MNFFKWLGSILILFWIISLILKIGTHIINIFLILAALTFLIDIILTKKKTM